MYTECNGAKRLVRVTASAGLIETEPFSGCFVSWRQTSRAKVRLSLAIRRHALPSRDKVVSHSAPHCPRQVRRKCMQRKAFPSIPAPVLKSGAMSEVKRQISASWWQPKEINEFVQTRRYGNPKVCESG